MRASKWTASLSKTLGALALVLPSMVAAQNPPPPTHSVRVATYNAYLLSPLFKCLGPLILDCLNQITDQTEGWAHRLADTILANPDRFDILVLNEVWDEDAKDILVNRLKAQYPVYVKKLDAPLVQLRAELVAPLPSFEGSKINGEDSGLMLFARKGFTALALPDNRHRWGGAKGTLKASTTRGAVKLFEDYDSDDGLAAKGVGFVRLRHDASGMVYNVAFTPLQADYPDSNEFFPATRKKQLGDVRRVIEQTLAPLGPLSEVLKRERLIVAGDLNVSVLTHGQAEWQGLFNTAGSFFTKPLYDAWRASSPDASLGITNEVDGDRLDYLLAAVEPYKHGLAGRMPLCVQHSTVPVDFQQLESDHFMVHADLNRGFWHCHPRIAYEVTAADLTGQKAINKSPSNPAVDITRIAYPGAMQWFHVKAGTPGTYTIGRVAPAEPVTIDIYAADDLTTPISRYNKTTTKLNLGQGVWLDQFVLPAEYYIRITGPTRAWTGDYALTIKRHTCASRQEACLLQPGQPQGAQLTGAGEVNTIGQIQNEAWFRFDVTGQSDAGVAQTIEVAGLGLPAGPNYSASLVDFVNTGGQPALTVMAQANGLRRKGPAGDGASGFVVLKQQAPGPASASVFAGFDTSLRILEVGNLVCADETNPELGSDDIYTRFEIDGSWSRQPSSGYKEFDCDNSRHSRNWGTYFTGGKITYVDAVKVRLSEEDDTSADDPSRQHAIPALAAIESFKKGVLKWSFSDGRYELHYGVRKRANGPVK